jgi:hypothetical protein
LLFDSHVPVQQLSPEDNGNAKKLIRANYPLRLVVVGLSGSRLRKIAAVHGVPARQKDHVDAIRRQLEDHECVTCPETITVYQLVANTKPEKMAQARATAQAWREAKRDKKMDAVKASAALLKKRRQIRDRRKKEREPSKDAPSRFPPVPPSQGLRHQVISGMCDELDPATLEEMGCAVCGSLTPRIELTKMTDTTVNWDVLKVAGVTRKERFTNHDPIEELDGPVLADGCDSVCTDCESTLLKGAVPLRSLANNIWIGCVPWQLKDLSFAERMLISKVRHNRCVVRVASGRGKMSANAIMFATPIVKIYQVLPVSKDELSEVLAFVFLGSARPTEEDFARTPMLVRRTRVKDALDWLKLNHRDYTDLEISPENLQDLPENGIPCGVDWKETVEGETNNVAEAMSVHDTGEEEEGICCFRTDRRAIRPNGH